MAKKEEEKVKETTQVVEKIATVQTETTPSVVDATQKIETDAYVPTYRIKPEFKRALLGAIGDLPFNQIAGLIQAIDVDIIDHQTLTQIINAVGQFPFTRVETLMKNINSLVEQNMPE
jgi:hypothetical protein